MRTRIRDDRVGPRYALVRKDNNTGYGSSSTNPFWTAYVGQKSVMRDFNNGASFTRGFVMSPCHLERWKREATENPVVECTALNSNGSIARRTFSGDFAGYVAYGFQSPLEVDMGNAASLALVEAYAKMNTSPTLAGEQIATLKETIGMIRSPFASATKLAKKAWKLLAKRKKEVRRAYIRDKRRLVKIKAKPGEHARLARAYAEDLARAAADVRLEFRYGMLPLMLDAEAHAAFITQKLRNQSEHGQMMVARSKRYKGQKDDSYSGPVGIGLDMVYEPTSTVTRSTTVEVSAGVAYRVTAGTNIDQLQRHLGLNVRDVPITALALVPLSFVADWALNMEEWLQAILPVPGIQPLGNWVTTKTTRVTSVSGVSFDTYLGWGTNHRVGVTFPGGSETYFSYQRVVDNSLATHPMLLGKPLSNTHIGDGAALMVNKFISAVRKIL